VILNKDILSTPNYFQALEVTGNNEHCRWYWQKIKVHRGELESVEQKDGRGRESLKSQLDSSLPLILCYHQEDVLSKIADQSSDHRSAIDRAFPQLQQEDFYVDVIPVQGTQSNYTALVRKENIQDWFDFFQDQKISVVHLSVGFDVFLRLYKNLTQEAIVLRGRAIFIEQNRLVLKENEIEQSASSELNMGGYSLPSDFVIGFLSTVQFLSALTDRPFSLFLLNQGLKEDYSKKKLSKKALQIGLASALLILLTNFIFYLHYQQKIQDLDQAYSTNQSALLVKNLKQAVSNKKNQIKAYDLEGKSNFTYILEQMALARPQGIELDEVTAGETVEIQEENNPNVLLLSGNAGDYSEIIKWKHRLDSIPLVLSSELVQFEKSRRAKFLFQLQVKFSR